MASLKKLYVSIGTKETQKTTKFSYLRCRTIRNGRKNLPEHFERAAAAFFDAGAQFSPFAVMLEVPTFRICARAACLPVILGWQMLRFPVCVPDSIVPSVRQSFTGFTM